MPGAIDVGSTAHTPMPPAKKSLFHNALLGRSSLSLCGSVLVMGIVTVFAPLIDGGTTHLPVMIIRLILLSVCSVWIFYGLQSGTLTIYRTRLLWLVGVFTGLSGLSLLWSPYLNVGLQQFVSLLTYTAFFSVALHGANAVGHVRVLVMLLLGMGLFEGGLGIVQYVWLGEPRAKGTFFNPNFFATYEVVTLMLALGLMIFMRRDDFAWKEKLFLACTAAAAFLGLVVAQSRGALLAFLIAVMFVGLCRYGRTALILLLVLVLGGFVLPNPMKQRILEVSAHDPYAYTRFEIWENSLHRIADHPWGVGLGMYKYSSFQYRFPIEHAIVRYGKRAESAHNEYLQMAVELGVGGLLLFLIGIGVWGWEAKKALAGASPRWERGAVVGLCGGVLAILVHASVDSVFHEPALVLLLILSGSLVLVLKRLNEPRPVPTWSIPFPYHPARVTVAMILVVSLAFLSIQPASAWFAFEQGSRASQSGHSMSAREWYQRAILIDPGTTAYRDAAALADVKQFRESGDPRWLIQAVEGIKLGMALNPLDGRLPYRLGTLYLLLAERASFGEQRTDLVVRAALSYADAINADPFSPFNYVELAKLRWQQGDVEEAKALLTQAVHYEPNFLSAKILLAQLAMNSGHIDFARSQVAMIRETRERYRGRTLTPLEKEYVDVSLDSLDQAIAQ